ncbi:hypothetical protein QE152_g8029 [Popillia japonica]|uniref:Uncharacterized protein n=1 Tax=Popillia japonica TaxID=7064 RepID=A0AAW1MDW4_POPJA
MSDIDSEQEGYPAILEKSQIAAMKQKKTAALAEIVKEHVTLFGNEMEMKDFMKKVKNMKTRLKNKTDKNKTGNSYGCRRKCCTKSSPSSIEEWTKERKYALYEREEWDIKLEKLKSFSRQNGTS